MLCSYIIEARFPSSEILGGSIPTIFQIQDWVESAWDNGINTQGRIETGGIKGTRKYIGTPEVSRIHFRLVDVHVILTRKRHKLCLSIWAFRKNSQILSCASENSYSYRCDAEAFTAEKGVSQKQAYDLLLEYVESYFAGGCSDYHPSVRNTLLPPLYFQHPGMLLELYVMIKMTVTDLEVE